MPVQVVTSTRHHRHQIQVETKIIHHRPVIPSPSIHHRYQRTTNSSSSRLQKDWPKSRPLQIDIETGNVMYTDLENSISIDPPPAQPKAEKRPSVSFTHLIDAEVLPDLLEDLGGVVLELERPTQLVGGCDEVARRPRRRERVLVHLLLSPRTVNNKKQNKKKYSIKKKKMCLSFFFSERTCTLSTPV